MYAYCPQCYQSLIETGLASQVYMLICENFAIYDVPIALYDPHWKEVMRYLEISGYIVTSEATNDLTFARPCVIALDDGDTSICCTGACEFSKIDLKEGEA